MSARVRGGRAPGSWQRALLASAALALALARTHEDGQPGPAETARPRMAHNQRAAGSSRVLDLEATFGLTGRGLLIGQWDEGAVYGGHRDLQGRVRDVDLAPLSDHATHVAGTMIGSGSGDQAARGMAVEAGLWSFRWDWDEAEARTSAPYLAVAAHAYGLALGWAGEGAGCTAGPTWFGGAAIEDGAFGRYGVTAARLDTLIYETDLVSVWAAGNERMDFAPNAAAAHYHFPDCATPHRDHHASELEERFDTLGGPITAKNAIAVGAVASGSALAEELVPIAVSSFGPTDDGRIKPDLVAGGFQLHSSSIAAAEYATFGGTSSAAGVVAGGIALLTEQYRSAFAGRDPRAAEVKALLLHTAREAGAAPGPDFAMGFGLFDARAAGDLIASDTARESGDTRQLRVASIASNSEVTLRSAELAPRTAVRVTIAWTDPGATANDAAADDRRPALVNDLDLVLIAPDGETVFHPWRREATRPDAPARRDAKNAVDNVEQVDVDADQNEWRGRWTVKVSAGELYRDRPQAFAVVASEPIEAAQSPVLGSTRRVHVEAAEGEEPESAALWIENLGGGRLEWSIENLPSWLSVSESAGTAPARVILDFDTAGLERPGFYTGTLLLTSSDPTAAARRIGVVMQLRCAAECRDRECGADAACGSSCGLCREGSACDPDGRCVPLVDECPSGVLGSERGRSVASGSTLQASNRTHGSCGGADSNEASFTWTAPNAGRYVFTTAAPSSETVLYVRDGGCDGPELSCRRTAEAGLALDLEGGQVVTAFVDGESSSGGFTFRIDRERCPVVDLEARLGTDVVQGNTAHGVDARSGSCGGAGTPEVTFLWTAPNTGVFSFAVDGLGTDGSLYALAGDCSGTELACAAGRRGERLDLELAAGEPVVIAVDTERHAAFGLSITSSEGICAGHCDGSPNHGACFCDPICLQRGDCCADVCAVCGHGCASPSCDRNRCPTGERCEDGGCVTEPCRLAHDGGACDDGGAGARCPDGGCESGGATDAALEGGPSTEAGASPPARGASGCSCRATTVRARLTPLSAIGIALLVWRRRRRRCRGGIDEARSRTTTRSIRPPVASSPPRA